LHIDRQIMHDLRAGTRAEPYAFSTSVSPGGGVVHVMGSELGLTLPDVLLGSILSVAMMLRFSFGLGKEADLIECAVSDAVTSGARTADIANESKHRSTAEMGDAVTSRLTDLLN
jgi:Isocitrate/isopropylmalate dehydrogenase